jgi:Flp pilus assembly protein TadD
MGNALKDQGQLAEAAECYRQALRLDPDHADALNNLGVLLMLEGQLAEAVDCFRHALRGNPHHTDAHNNLGAALFQQGHLAEEIECYHEALRSNPNNADAHNNLGIALQGQGRPDEAIEHFRRAVRGNPDHAEAHNNLGIALYEQGRPDEAIECFRQALRCNPHHADALNSLGFLLKRQRSQAEALVCFRQALRSDPHHAEAHNNLGIALKEQGQPAEAIECFRRALSSNPRHVEAHNCLGATLVYLGRFAEARDHYEQALAIDPVHATTLWNRALWRLQQGDFATAWPDYEQRWALPNNAARPFEQPRWDGAGLAGKTILVYAEQGLGDTIQFVRYLPLVKARGGTVVFECQSALAGLCSGADGVDQVIVQGAPLPPFDVQVPLLSLPGIFGTTLATIPVAVPCLHAEPSLVEKWRRVLEPLKGFKVGIVWQGKPTNQGDCYRSIPFKHFEALAHVDGVRLLSLQVGPGSEQLTAASVPITNLGERFDPNSLGDLAAVLMNVDLVVTVETAVAHLAGALGVPVWVMLSVAGDWRWLLERSDSPWYPTMRLFRRQRFGDWEDVFDRVVAELKIRLTGLPHAPTNT